MANIMAYHIVTDVDGNKHRRIFKTGRNKLPVEIKAVRRNITLSPAYDLEAEKWKERTGMSFSAWIELQMYKTIHTETA